MTPQVRPPTVRDPPPLAFPPSGYFPNELRAIFRKQVHLIQKAIIESEQTRAVGEGGCCCPGSEDPGPREYFSLLPGLGSRPGRGETGVM